ncbi:MAG: choice-of-anchor J domain-containing protein [Bacteroidota bacterium]|nr:choice-of-anchor J domain-containing protein [Bacteroidota bacterium]
MKKFTYLILAGVFMLIFQDSRAQFPSQHLQKAYPNTPASRQTPPRCYTMEALDIYFRNHPEAKAMAERNNNVFAPETPRGQNQRIQTIVTVPVVFHIVGNATRQAQVTDADVLWQLNKLNEDYSGANADSTNASYGFYPIRAYNGYCQIRYCMAQRTPIDLPTNGIDRVVSTLTGTQNCNDVNTNGNATLVKHASSGGADSWDASRYLNIWVGEFGPCLLGIATFPGTGPSNEQGVCVSYEGFSNNPVYVDPAFALGRTAVHESGHYWGLLHIWGDESGCVNSDFRQLPGTCVLPASLAGSTTDQTVGDTPNQAGATTTCPSGAHTDACSSSAPGINYQNYMDYTEDACYSMFTLKQVDRMQWVLDNCRASLKTSNGCTPPPLSAANDARISVILNPTDGSTIGCSSVTPVVMIQNLGSNILTSATINVRLDGVLIASQPWAGSLTQGSSATKTLNPISISTVGAHVLKIHTTLPNGQGDGAAANDTATSNITRIAASPLPTTNGFETSLLPAGWTLNNPDNDALAWFRFNPSGGSAGGSVWAAVIDNYDLNFPGTNDDIVTPVINTSGLLANDSVLINFDLAYKNYPDPGFSDTLKVLVSNNCGATWTTLWAKGGPDLATAGSSANIYNPPAAGDWKNQRISIGNNLFGGGQIQVAIRNVNEFGNVVWLDNINISLKPRKDMQTTAILKPNVTECSSSFTPSINVKNAGGETVTGFKIGYILNNAAPVIEVKNISLAPGTSTTVSFSTPLHAPSGTNTIKMFVAEPLTASPGPDGTPGNDTLTRTFAVPVTVTNVIQGFEGSTFVPANWTLFNPQNDITWTRSAGGKNSDFSASIDNYDNPVIPEADIMQLPLINTAGADSLIITFDVAHKNYPGSFDSLRVLVSTNCGTSFSVVYDKSGSTLATAGSSTDPYAPPAPGDWRSESIRLGNTFTGGSTLVQFSNTNDFGNYVYVDNINIVPVFKRDIEVLSISPDIACSTTGYAPVVKVHNRGTETVDSFTVAYTIGAGTPVIQTFLVSIAPGGIANVTLASGSLSAGPNNIKVYTSKPYTASGSGDQYLANDTLTKVTYATGIVQAPTSIVETFEGNFLPSGWAITNPDNAVTWQKSGAGNNSNGSAYLRNFHYYSTGQKDGLYTPALNFAGVDSVKVSFDLSAAAWYFPGSTTVPTDTLEILATKDCGATYTSVYKKWGSQLQTISDPNYPQTTEFTPFASYLWRTEYIDLTSFAPSGSLQLVFRNTTGTQNNVFIDNVNFRTVTLPPRLKAEGVIVTPNPFIEQFNIWFVQAPSDLRYINVFNSAGQLIWKQEYGSGSASNIINVNMSGLAAGVYVINLGYSDKGKNKEIRVLKSN